MEGIDVINKISGLKDESTFRDPSSIIISTQITTDEGRPDIEVKSEPFYLIYIEVKHDSPLGVGQLEAYSNQLKESGYEITKMVLLTRSRSSASETTLATNEYHHVCWYEIHSWLSEIESEDDIVNYLVNEFNSFLEEKNMGIKRITWEYERGVPALMNLTDMIQDATGEVNSEAKFKRTAGWSWRGLYLDDEIFVGIRYHLPLVIVFENNNGNSPTFKRDLDLNQAHFFSLSSGEQFECVINFLREATLEFTAEKQ